MKKWIIYNNVDATTTAIEVETVVEEDEELTSENLF